jgi:hypothetical protein
MGLLLDSGWHDGRMKHIRRPSMWRVTAPVVWILAVALVAGAAVGTVAQDSDAAAPSAVLGWVLDETHVADGSSEEIDGVLQRRGPSYSYEFRSEDPRIAGRAVWTGNGDRYQAEPMFEIQSTTWEIVNDGGRWFGPGRSIRGQGFGETNFMELTGEGDYEGLSAFLILDFGLGGGRFRGAIFPGEMPPTP